MSKVKATALVEIRRNHVDIPAGFVIELDADEFARLLRKKAVRIPTDVDLALQRLRDEGTVKVTAKKPRKPRAKVEKKSEGDANAIL